MANLTLAIPTLALLTILPLTPLGFGKPPVIVALAVFAVPPLLANAYTGLRSVDPETREAAKGMGLSGGQLLRRVELPLAVPYLAAGLRTAAVQVVATAALAAFVNGGGLGEIISGRIRPRHQHVGGGQIVGGGIVVALLALLVEGAARGRPTAGHAPSAALGAARAGPLGGGHRPGNAPASFREVVIPSG